MSYRILLAMALALLPFHSAHAENQDETWYFHFGLGYAHPAYTGKAQSMVDTFTTQAVHSTWVQLALQLELGVYWPLFSKSLAFGFSDFAIADSFATSSSPKLSLSQGFIGPSVMWFTGSHIGSGLFMRADAGIAYLLAQPTGLNGFSSSPSPSNIDVGYGLQGGTGIALPVFDRFRFLINLLYSHRVFSGSSADTVMIGISGLY